jgi:hypothetical protein
MCLNRVLAVGIGDTTRAVRAYKVAQGINMRSVEGASHLYNSQTFDKDSNSATSLVRSFLP